MARGILYIILYGRLKTINVGDRAGGVTEQSDENLIETDGRETLVGRLGWTDQDDRGMLKGTLARARSVGRKED